jgi:hypothetical protein
MDFAGIGFDLADGTAVDIFGNGAPNGFEISAGGFGNGTFTLRPAAVAAREPATLGVLGVGLAGLITARRRRV